MYLKQETKEFTGQDIYFMEAAGDKIIINDNYEGVLVLDSELHVVKIIHLLNDLVIENAYVNEKEAVLYSYENACFIHISMDTYDFKVIMLPSAFKEKIFLPFYEWTDSHLLLLADAGKTSVDINLSEGSVQSAQNGADLLLYDDWKQLQARTIQKADSQRKEAIVESDNKIWLINYQKGTKTRLEIPPFETEPFYFHDVEWLESNVAQVSEQKIFVYTSTGMDTLSPDSPQYRFLRAKFFIKDETVCLFTLSADNSDSGKDKIDKWIRQEGRL